MRLVCFGDSWTNGVGIEDDIKYRKDKNPPIYIQKLREQNSWPRWVAEKLGCTYINLGSPANDNFSIFCTDLKHFFDFDLIKEDDVIVIMFTFPHRNVFKEEHSFLKTYEKIELLLKNHKHFYFNSFYPTFKDFNYDTKNLPSYFINPNGCVSDLLIEYENKNNISIWEHNQKSVHNDDVHFIRGNYHPNLLGYKIIGEYIYNNIIDKI